MSKLPGDAHEKPAWRAWANEIIANEVPYFTDASLEIERAGLRHSVLHSMQQVGGDLYRQFVADAALNMIRDLINKNIASGQAAYALGDREAKRVRRMASYYREKVTIPLGGNEWGGSKPREACTLSDARLIVAYRHQRQRHERREERWWQAVINRMEREHCAEDARISVVIRKQVA